MTLSLFVKFIDTCYLWSSLCQFCVRSKSAAMLMKFNTMTN